MNNTDPYFKGFTVPEIPTCLSPLGLQSGQVPNHAMTAFSSSCSPHFGRLLLHSASGITGGWCAKANDFNQWLQIDFGSYAKVHRVATQGRQEASQWVESYKLSYSQDGVFFQNYDKVRSNDIPQNPMVIVGNCCGWLLLYIYSCLQTF